MGLLRGLVRFAGWLIDQAVAELRRQRDEITAELSELNKELEAGTVTEAEFERREAEQIERLTLIERTIEEWEREQATWI